MVLGPGDVCGGYVIVRLLGAGGFSEVYEAHDASGARFALKIIKARAAAGARLHARLAREAEALRRIQHSNVVRLFDVGADDDRAYFVLELVEGRTLADQLAADRGLPPIDSALTWLLQACEGVAEVHRVGVIHRDLKPANIIITPSNLVKVIDFGVAKLRGLGVPTTSGGLVGTALYMAPEQVRGERVDARADVYAMGVILYEALAGVHPVDLDPDASTLLDVLRWHDAGKLRSLAEAAPEIAPALASLVHGAMATDPDKRVPSMVDLAQGLREALAALPATSSTRTRPTSALVGRTAMVGDPSPLAKTLPGDQPREAMPPPAPLFGVAVNKSPDGAGARRADGAPRPEVPSSTPSLRHGSSLPVVSERRRSRPPRRFARSMALGVAAALSLAVGALFWIDREHHHAELPAPTTSPPSPLPIEATVVEWLGAGKRLVVEAGAAQTPDVIGYCADREKAAVCAFDGATLRLRWRRSSGVDRDRLGPIAAAGNWVAYADERAVVHVVDLATGALRGDVPLGSRATRLCDAPAGAAGLMFVLENGDVALVDPGALTSSRRPLPPACDTTDVGARRVTTRHGLTRIVYPSDVAPALSGWSSWATRVDGAIGVQLGVNAPSGTVPELVGFTVRPESRGTLRWRRPVPPGDGLTGRVAGATVELAGGRAVTLYEHLSGGMHIAAFDAATGAPLWDVTSKVPRALMVGTSRVYAQVGFGLAVRDAVTGKPVGQVGPEP